MTDAIISTLTDVAHAIGLAALFAPVAVVAGRRAARHLDPVEAVTVGVGGVAALLVLGGLALAALDALELLGWLALAAAGDVLALVASVDGPRRRRVGMSAALATLAIGLTVGAVAVSHMSARDRANKTKFTQLWLLPRANGGAEVGIRNEERRPAAFRLKVYGPGGQPLLLDRPIVLKPGGASFVPLDLPRTDRPMRINAELYKPGAAAAYRATHVWTEPTAATR